MKHVCLGHCFGHATVATEISTGRFRFTLPDGFRIDPASSRHLFTHIILDSLLSQ